MTCHLSVLWLAVSAYSALGGMYWRSSRPSSLLQHFCFLPSCCEKQENIVVRCLLRSAFNLSGCNFPLDSSQLSAVFLQYFTKHIHLQDAQSLTVGTLVIVKRKFFWIKLVKCFAVVYSVPLVLIPFESYFSTTAKCIFQITQGQHTYHLAQHECRSGVGHQGGRNPWSKQIVLYLQSLLCMQ